MKYDEVTSAALPQKCTLLPAVGVLNGLVTLLSEYWYPIPI